MIYVIDASAAVEFLLRTNAGRSLDPLIWGARLLAPELLDVEVLSVLRREVLSKRLRPERAAQALEDLIDWDVERVPHRRLLADAWEKRGNVTAYDGFYVALAKQESAPILSADGPLSRAPGLEVVIQNIRVPSVP